MNTENLTPIQQKLVDELISEFTKINPKPNANGAKRFSFDTITECNKEEERFKATMTKHNMTMMKVFIGQLENELKAFKKEFGKVLNIQLGGAYGRPDYHTIEYLVDRTKKAPLDKNESYEIFLFLVSKTRKYYNSSSTNPNGHCNGMDYQHLYVGFKYERVVHTLESGKELVVYKIVGLQYSTREYLYRDKQGVTKGTLDELIQSCKSTQQKIVELANIK